MKKYFWLAAISAALLLTACGSNQNDTAETSAQTSLTTLNSITEMTVPAFNPEWDEATVTEVTSPAYAPNSDELPLTTTSVCSVPLETIEVVSETTAIQTTEIALKTSAAQTAELTTAAVTEEKEDIFFEATVLGVEEKAILVQMKGDTFIGEDGIDVYIFGSYDVEKGDTVNIVFTEEVGIDESYPPEIKAQFIVSLEKSEYADGYDLPYDSGDYDVPDVELGENEHVAYVTAVYELKNGGYSLTVEAYNVAGYYSPVPISLHSETEFAVGDWVKVEFAPETCFMETSPLQVNKSDVLSIELIDY
ncbi:MAG: hypothetical protein IJ305_03835 [Oscillospiraceae bacterium]|nr:hypothetical protein [Oscillospiraceae bacterium]